MTVFEALSKKKLQIWHRTLVHPSLKSLATILKSCNESFKLNENFFCDACQLSKSHSLPYSLSLSYAKAPFEIVHIDVWGRSPLTAPSDHRYYVTFIDDYSHFTWLYPLKQNLDVHQAFTLFKQQTEIQFGRKIKCLQSDMGGEFTALTQTLQNNRIKFRYSCPFSSAQNGRDERKH